MIVILEIQEVDDHDFRDEESALSGLRLSRGSLDRLQGRWSYRSRTWPQNGPP